MRKSYVKPTIGENFSPIATLRVWKRNEYSGKRKIVRLNQFFSNPGKDFFGFLHNRFIEPKISNEGIRLKKAQSKILLVFSLTLAISSLFTFPGVTFATPDFSKGTATQASCGCCSEGKTVPDGSPAKTVKTISEPSKEIIDLAKESLQSAASQSHYQVEEFNWDGIQVTVSGLVIHSLFIAFGRGRVCPPWEVPLEPWPTGGYYLS